MTVVIPSKIRAIQASTFQGCTSLQSATLPQLLTSIGESAFRGCSSLLSISIPKTTTSIAKEAFRSSGLTSIVLPEKVTTVEQGVFHSCVDLASATIEGKITSIGANAFHSCVSLRSLTLPQSLTSIGSEAFRQSGLRSIVIPNTVKVLENNLFYGCTQLTSATLREDRTSSENITTIKNGAFQECRNLESISIPHSVTSIGKSAFEWCERMKVAFMSGNAVETIPERAFFGCSSLTYLLLPDKLKEIKKEAFRGCTNLTTLVVPSGVKTIEDRAFYSCGSLTDIYYAGSATDWRDPANIESNYPLISATIHYNAHSVLNAEAHSSFTASAPVGSGAYATLIDFANCELQPKSAYTLYYAFYNSNGKMLSAKSEAVAFTNGFPEFILPIQDAKAGMTCRIFLFDEQFVPLTKTQVNFTAA